MTTDRLEKSLFPRFPPCRQKCETKTLMAALAVGFFVAGIVTAMFVLANSAGS
jgi:hypothetical protein